MATGATRSDRSHSRMTETSRRAPDPRHPNASSVANRRAHGDRSVMAGLGLREGALALHGDLASGGSPMPIAGRHEESIPPKCLVSSDCGDPLVGLPAILTPAEVAAVLRMRDRPDHVVLRLARQGLRVFRLGRQTRVLRSDLAKWISDALAE